jgi:hypothetical protein
MRQTILVHDDVEDGHAPPAPDPTGQPAPGAPRRPRRHRARLAALIALAALLAGGIVASTRIAAADRPSLYVFLHTDAKSTVLERTLQLKLPELTVTVFGRFRDFEEALAAKPPDAVLALEPLLASRSFKAALHGVAEGDSRQRFVLLSAGAPLVGALGERTVGVVDLLGRKDTQAFVSKLLKTPDVHIKLVTKLEDLLSLLQFSAADAILVPASMVKPFSERSRLSLHVRELPDALVGRAAVAVLSAEPRAAIVRAISHLDTGTNRMMDLDGWRGE